MASHRFNAGAPGRLRRGSRSPGLPNGPNILAVAQMLCQIELSAGLPVSPTMTSWVGRSSSRSGFCPKNQIKRQDEEGGGRLR